MKDNSFRDTDGVRIRRQYFNYIILDLMLVFLFFFIMRTFTPVLGRFDIDEWAKSVGSLALRIGGIALPFAVLSVFNLFFFGKTVCVINEDGIHYRNGLIRWDDILYLKFKFYTYSKFRTYYPSYITVVCKQQKIEITSAPFYMFFVAKKFKRNIRIKIDKTLLIYIGIVIGGAVMCLFSYYY